MTANTTKTTNTTRKAVRRTTKVATKPARSKKYYYGVGRRKTSTATVRLYPNWKGEILITSTKVKNKKLEDYFGNVKDLVEDALYPFYILGQDVRKKFDMTIHVRWWWVRWHAEAIRLGISRALVEYFPDWKKQLKPYWLLKRDDRSKERKKPGLKKARKAPQWSKR